MNFLFCHFKTAQEKSFEMQQICKYKCIRYVVSPSGWFNYKLLIESKKSMKTNHSVDSASFSPSSEINMAEAHKEAASQWMTKLFRRRICQFHLWSHLIQNHSQPKYKSNNKSIYQQSEPMCPIFPPFQKLIKLPNNVPHNNKFCDFTIKINKLREHRSLSKIKNK